MCRVASCAKMISPSATAHVTTIEFVIGNFPTIGSSGAASSTALAVRPSSRGSPALPFSISELEASAWAHSATTGTPARHRHTRINLIKRISRKTCSKGLPRPLDKTDFLAGSRENLPDREKFHKRYFEEF